MHRRAGVKFSALPFPAAMASDSTGHGVPISLDLQLCPTYVGYTAIVRNNTLVYQTSEYIYKREVIIIATQISS